MTLALYGKSRKRQGGLLLAALLAIIGAAVGGLMLIGTAFAHANAVSGVATCQSDGTYSIKWTITNDYNATETVNKATLNGGATNLSSSVSPNPLAKYGSAALTTVVPGTSTSAQLDVWARWSDGYPKPGDNAYTPEGRKDSGYVSMNGKCGQKAKIIIKKVVTGTGADTSQNFTANVTNTDHSAGTTTGLTFSQDTPKIYEFNSTNSNDDFDVSEVNLPAGYTLYKVWSSADNKSCPVTSGYGARAWGDPSGANSNTAPSLDDVGNGDTFTVCFWNKYTAPPPTPTVTKAIAQTATDATKAYWDITIDNTATGAIARSGIVIADAGASLDSASPASCTPATGSGNWTCSVTAGGKTVLHVSKLLSTATYPNGVCKPGSINNSVTSATMGQTTLTVTNPASAITLPAKADLSCLSFKKERLSDTSYKITIHNTGPATTVDVTDTFAPDGTTQTLASPAPAGCSLSNGNLTLTCTAYTVAANSDTTITVNTTAYTNSQVCQDQTVTNTAAITRGGSNVSVIPGASASASNTFKTTRTDCNNGNLVITKVKDPTTGVPVADSSMFNGTIDGAGDWKSGGIGFNQSTAPKSVSPGLHTVAETVTQNSWTPVGWALGNVDGCPAEKDAYSGGSNSQVSVATGQTTYACVMNTKQQEVLHRTLRVCKAVDDNSPIGGSFTITVSGQSNFVTGNIAPGGDDCKDYTVDDGSQVTVTETGKPASWVDADGYPMVGTGGTPSTGNSAIVTVGEGTCSANRQAPTQVAEETVVNPQPDCTVILYNKAKTISATFSKYICPAYTDVPRNSAGGQNDIGKPDGPSGLSNSNLGTSQGAGCELAKSQWTFELWTSDRVNGSGGTKLQTVNVTGTATVPLNSDVISHLNSDGQVYVQEVFQPGAGYGFGALKCTGDMVNDDNWEWLKKANATSKDGVTCTAYNVPATGKIIIAKVNVSGAPADTFTATIDGETTAYSFSQNAPTAPITVSPGSHTVSEASAAGYLASAWWLGQLGTDGKTVTCDIASAKQPDYSYPIDASITVPNGGTVVVCFENVKAPVIIVHKTWVGGSHTAADIPQITVQDSSQTAHPTVKTDGGNDTEWNSQTTAALGEVNVSEDLGTNSMWEVTASSGSCHSANTENLQALEEVANPSVVILGTDPGDICNVYFTNTRKTGTVVVKKVVEPGSTLAPNDQNPAFTGLFDGSSWGNLQSGQSKTFTGILSGSGHTITEQSGTVFSPGDGQWRQDGFYLGNADGVCPTGPSGATALDPNNITVAANSTTTICVLNYRNAPQEVSGSVTVIKKIVSQFPSATDTFTGTVSTPNSNANGGGNFSIKDGQGQVFIISMDTDHPSTTFSVAENAASGYTLLGYKVLSGGGQGCPAPDGNYLSSVASQSISTTSPAYTVCVYNQPAVTINVHKTEQNGLVTSNGAGWSVTVSGCSISQSAVTDASGNASFTNLPLCNSYIVSENVNSKGVGAFTPAGGYPASVAVNATTAGQVYTVLFANVKFNNPCGDGGCTPSILQTPTPTPVTPTATPVTPTVTQPTKTATQPAEVTTPTPTQVDKVHGEKTPGANATPLAPSTGSGLFGSGKSGSNLLLAVLGIFSLSAGFAVIAVANKNKSRS